MEKNVDFLMRCALCALAVFCTAGPLHADQLYSKNKKANQLYKKQHYADALKLYDDLSVEAPNEPKIKMNQGSAHYQMGDFDKAEESYNAAIPGLKDKKTLASAYYNLGNIHFMQGEQLGAQGKQEAMDKYKSALENYIKALDCSPRDRDAKWNLQLTSAKIKEMQNQQQKQNKNDQNKNDKNKNDKQNQQQNKDQKNDQNKKDQQNKDQQNKEQQKKDQQNKDNQNNKDQDQKNQNSQDNQQQQNQQKPQPQPAQRKQEDMKKDDARKLLELYSDDEHDLNKKPEKQGIAGQKKNEKDW